MNLKLERVLAFLFIFSLIYFISCLPGNPVHWDEGLFYEMAYWLKEIGYVKTPMWQMLDDPNAQQFVYHKLYILICSKALAMGFSGTYVLKFLSLIFFSILCVLLYFYYKNKMSKNALLLVFSLFFANYWSLFLGFTARPEALFVVFSFSSFIFLEQYLKSSHHRSLILLSGLLAGFSLYTHLNGIAPLVSGFLVLLYYRHFKAAFLYGLMGTFSASLYFIDLNSMSDFTTLLLQFKSDPALSKSKLGIAGVMLRLVHEYKRFFNHGYEASLSLLFIMAVFSQAKFFVDKHRAAFLYLIVQIVILAAISRSPVPNYLFMHFPFLFLFIGLHFDTLISKSNILKRKNTYVLVLIFLYLITNCGEIYKYQISNRGRGHQEPNPQYLSNLVPQSTVLITSNFAFFYIDKFKLLGARLVLFKKASLEQKIDLADYIDFATKRGASAMILDRRYIASSLIDNFPQEPRALEEALHKLGISLLYVDEFLVIASQSAI